jgi:hypothetical protein
MIDVDVDLDLSDLDLLDDPDRHAICRTCYPVLVPVGGKFVALCGRPAIRPMPRGDPSVIPLDACDACVALLHAPCQRCGF